MTVDRRTQYVQRTEPGRFADGQWRTLQRRIKRWRATEGPGKEVYFAQQHQPGELCQSDFTHCRELGITIAGRGVSASDLSLRAELLELETGSICYSESFESLSEGSQKALWELGGVPREHRSGRMSAAVNNLMDRGVHASVRGAAGALRLEGQKIQAVSGQ